MAEPNPIERLAAITNNIINGLVEAEEKALAKANKNLYFEFNRYQRRRIEEIFAFAVNEFYYGYTPAEYARTYGLFNVLDVRKNPDGDVLYDGSDEQNIDKLFDKDAMHTGRNGYNGLFDKVFVKGYHGGAEDGENHPSPGTPYYRGGPYHTFWSRPAVQTESPYEIMQRNLKSAESEFDEKFDEVRQKHSEEFVKDYVKRAMKCIISAFARG